MSDARLQREGNTVVAPRSMKPPSSQLVVPEVSSELINYLRQQFFPKVYKDRPERDYDVNVGQLEVVDHLEMLWEEQNPQEG